MGEGYEQIGSVRVMNKVDATDIDSRSHFLLRGRTNLFYNHCRGAEPPSRTLDKTARYGIQR